MSNFNNTSKYEADVEHSVVSLISNSFGYIESTYEWNWSLLIDKTSELNAAKMKLIFTDCRIKIIFLFAHLLYNNLLGVEMLFEI